MDPVQWLLYRLTPVQYVASFSAGKVRHLSLLSIAYGIVQDSTQYTLFSTHWLRASLESFLSLIIFFLVQPHQLLLPSLIVTSSQVRVSTPLPLLLCCISGLGPEGLLQTAGPYPFGGKPTKARKPLLWADQPTTDRRGIKIQPPQGTAALKPH